MANTYTVSGFMAGITQATEFGRAKEGASALMLRMPESGSDIPATFEIANESDLTKLNGTKMGTALTLHGTMDVRSQQKANRTYVACGKITRIEWPQAEPPKQGTK